MSAPLAKAPRKLILRPIALFAAMTTVFALAQTTPPPPSSKPPLPGTAAQREAIGKSVLTIDKFNRIDILGKLLPVNLTKEQMRALLPVIEKARAKEFEIRLLDAQEIAKLDAEVTKAVDSGIAKNDVPSVELQNKIRNVTRAVTIRRQIATTEMVEMIYEASKKNLDAGQLKVMANTLKPELIAPGTMAETEEQKIKFFIRYIFLDGLTYDLLLRMSKPA